ncbi:alpha/beta hydrolase [Stenotrophomonas sp. MMGLT7]|uniref:alpha/beta hydrolase n=1 Tax=Stenotrophomonas sp. MMGLT7 TaxID=2901227 RepID=UPI001E4FD0AA|nr:alpha/beta hydrolase [Stenotrophomonas sp. MMGLT7]MCD7097345.1 alpha/beta fold hydrolase [Stenotrophomonas sp. MMGLT7]
MGIAAGKSPRRWRRLAYALLALLLLLAAALALGPRVVPRLAESPLPQVPQDPRALQAWIDAREAATPNLRADTRARIVWADPAHPARSDCAIVYLHGFSASQGEGAPTHERLARTFGCNLYLPRLPGHGLKSEQALRGIDAQRLLDAAAEALAVGQVLGRRVVLVGTSMGGALALQTAAAHPRQVQSLVLWSPLVRERDDQLQPLLWPWGAQLLLWSRNRGDPVLRHRPVSAYWADAIHIDGYRALAALSRGGMLPAMFARVRMPVFLGYYYRDEQHQDATVSVAAMRAMFAQLGTPAAQREMVDFPQADNHVIASPQRSKAVPQVFASTCRFLAGQAHLPRAPGAPDCAAAWADYERQQWPERAAAP